MLANVAKETCRDAYVSIMFSAERTEISLTASAMYIPYSTIHLTGLLLSSAKRSSQCLQALQSGSPSVFLLHVFMKAVEAITERTTGLLWASFCVKLIAGASMSGHVQKRFALHHAVEQ